MTELRPWPPLKDCEQLVSDDGTEQWFRLVRVGSVDAGEIDPDALTGGASAGDISGTRSTKVSAKHTFDAAPPDRYTGVWALTVADVDRLGLRLVDDSDCPDRPVGHAYVDIRPYLGDGQAARKRRKILRENLADALSVLGCQYP